MSTPDLVPNASPTAAGPPPPPPLIPGRIGVTDVQRIEDANRAFRALDYQYGGGTCHDAVVGYLPRGLRMLGAYATGLVMDRLCVAVADLHNLAGWTSFDTGQVCVARIHFGRALELAKQGHNDALVANIRYRMGRVHLHHDAPDKALTEFQLGPRSHSGSPGRGGLREREDGADQGPVAAAQVGGGQTAEQRRRPRTVRADRHVHRHQARLLLDATTAALHAELRFALREGVAPADTVRPGSLSPDTREDRNPRVTVAGHEWG